MKFYLFHEFILSVTLNIFEMLFSVFLFVSKKAKIYFIFTRAVQQRYPQLYSVFIKYIICILFKIISA